MKNIVFYDLKNRYHTPKVCILVTKKYRQR